MRLATFNILHGRSLDDDRVDVDRFAEAVASLDADVVALQEVDHLLARSAGADQTAQIAAAIGGTGRFTATVHGTPGSSDAFRPAEATVPAEPSYGVALVSRFPVLAWRELRMPAGRARLPLLLPPGADRRLRLVPDEPRAVVAAVLDLGGAAGAGTLTVLGTHLSFAPPRAVRQLRALRAWAADLPRPLVLLGDLNLPPGVVGRVLPWRPLVSGATFPAPAPRLQLDHALADALDARVASAHVQRVGGSDHRGLVVDLEF